ncbi:MAG: tautomerase family protein, partial [Burkholderiaceae bacterium]
GKTRQAAPWPKQGRDCPGLMSRSKDLAEEWLCGTDSPAMHSAIGLPQNDNFQILAEHDEQHFIFDPGYLGIDRTDNLVVIQITLSEGRTIEQKKLLYKTIAESLNAELAVRLEDVFINLVEVKKENWSFGNGIAQYAS